jgi:hypothetical protein
MTLRNAIAARYPDAPACPTDEYRSAAIRMSAARISVVVSTPQSYVRFADGRAAGAGLLRKQALRANGIQDANRRCFGD